MDSDEKIPDPPRWMMWLPIAAITLSLTILLFQAFVLHSWHIKLSNQMRHVKGKLS
jgi:hypothetical protein